MRMKFRNVPYKIFNYKKEKSDTSCQTIVYLVFSDIHIYCMLYKTLETIYFRERDKTIAKVQ